MNRYAMFVRSKTGFESVENCSGFERLASKGASPPTLPFPHAVSPTCFLYFPLEPLLSKTLLAHITYTAPLAHPYISRLVYGEPGECSAQLASKPSEGIKLFTTFHSVSGPCSQHREPNHLPSHQAWYAEVGADRRVYVRLSFCICSPWTGLYSGGLLLYRSVNFYVSVYSLFTIHCPTIQREASCANFTQKVMGVRFNTTPFSNLVCFCTFHQIRPMETH